MTKKKTPPSQRATKGQTKRSKALTNTFEKLKHDTRKRKKPVAAKKTQAKPKPAAQTLTADNSLPNVLDASLAATTVVQFTRKRGNGFDTFKHRNIGKTRGALVVCATSQKAIELLEACAAQINNVLDADLGL